MDEPTATVSDDVPKKISFAKEWTFKLILLGDTSVGKTSLLRRYANDETPTGVYKPTIGVDFRAKQLEVEGEYVRVLIWDTAGQERFKTMTKQYYRGSHGVILVYDVTNADSFDHVERWVKDFQKHVGDGVEKILVGNKCDAKESERQVTPEEGQLLGIQLDMPFMETSAKTDENVSEMFMKLITELVVLRKRRTSYMQNASIPSRLSSLGTPDSNEVVTIQNDEKKDKSVRRSRCGCV